MTTNITLPSAVVEQALDALEAVCGGRCNAEYNPCWQREVAETLRAALAQQAKSPCACWPGRMCSRQAQCAATVRAQQAEPQPAELSAALGWPGGISEPVLDRKTLLQMVAALMQDKLGEDHRVRHLWDHTLAQQTELVQEPVVLKWLPAPRKTEWGFGMVSADVEIDRDHTLTLYCEDDQTAKVDAMFRRVFCKGEA